MAFRRGRLLSRIEETLLIRRPNPAQPYGYDFPSYFEKVVTGLTHTFSYRNYTPIHQDWTIFFISGKMYVSGEYSAGWQRRWDALNIGVGDKIVFDNQAQDPIEFTLTSTPTTFRRRAKVFSDASSVQSKFVNDRAYTVYGLKHQYKQFSAIVELQRAILNMELPLNVQERKWLVSPRHRLTDIREDDHLIRMKYLSDPSKDDLINAATNILQIETIEDHPQSQEFTCVELGRLN